MVNYSSNPEVNKIANQQIDYFVNKFKQNQNEYVLRAKAEIIVKNSLKDWTPQKGNLKTYLTSKLQQLSREIYKNQIVYVPENQQLLMYKAKNVIDQYKDTHGVIPSAKELAKDLKITEKKAKNLLQLYGGVSKVQFNTDEGQIEQNSFSPKEIINSIPDKLHRDIAKDMYLKNKDKNYIFNKYGIKQTKFYEIKKNIDNHVEKYAERMNSYRSE